MTYYGAMITYNINSAAELLGIHPDTLQERAASGEIPGAKIGKSWIFLEPVLSEWLSKEIERQTELRLNRSTNTKVVPIIKKTRGRKKPIPELPPLPQVVSQN